MTDTPIQDLYEDDYSHCYGCGRLNEHGLRIKTRWDGRESVSEFEPQPYHMAVPGYVYGGLIASLVDCHGTATAAAAASEAHGVDLRQERPLRFVTASLQVDYLRPTPQGVPLTLRGRIKDLGERRVTVEVSLFADGEEKVRGRVVAARMPERMKQ